MPKTNTTATDDATLAGLYERRREVEAEAAEKIARIDRAIAAYLGEVRPSSTASASPKQRRHSAPTRKPTTKRAPISWLSESHQILFDNARPMHWKEIAGEMRKKGLSVPEDRIARDIICGVLGRRARAGKEFVRTAEGTFGLLQWNGNGKKSASAPATRQKPSRPESTTTLKLMEIIQATPGLTTGEIVRRLEAELGESEADASAKRNSRITRVGQLYNRQRVRRENGRYYPL